MKMIDVTRKLKFTVDLTCNHRDGEKNVIRLSGHSPLAFGVMGMMRQSRDKVHSIHALRGAAALFVVIAHALEHGYLGGAPIVFVGRFSVEVFFVISGFVITLAAGPGSFSFWNFAKQRFLRVVPLYWATTFAISAIALITPDALRNTTFELEYFVKSILFIPVSVPGTNDWRPIFKLGWTLNYEMFFYAAVSILFWVKSGLHRSCLLLAIMSAFVIGSFFIDVQSSILAFYANLNLLPFMAGIVFAELYRGGRLPRPTPVLLGITLVLGLVLILTAASFAHESLRLPVGHFFLTGGAICVVLFGLLLERVPTVKNQFLSWLGDISYSAYLLHMFVIGFGWLVIKELDVDLGANPAFALLFLGMVGGSMLIGWLSFRFVEKPIVRLGKARPVASLG